MDSDVERAKERGCERIWTASADGWHPPVRFAYVRTGLEYVPASRQEAFVSHLADHVVAPGGRLIIGESDDNRGRSRIAERLRSWGRTDVCEGRRPHSHPEVETSVVWFDL